MSKTFAQSGLEFEYGKQRLNDHQPWKRREPLLLETKLWNLVDTARDLCFTIGHFMKKLFGFISKSLLIKYKTGLKII